MKSKKLSNTIIYQAPNGAIELKGDFSKETVWANQSQIAELFDVDQSVISRHIRNIVKDGEVDQKSNMQKMHIANSDKPVAFYSLDIILSVGYRTNSKIATQFRQWATKTLKQHITEGYTINKKLISKNYKLFQQALTDIQNISQNQLSSNDILELIKAFSQTWFSLDAYDKSELKAKSKTQKSIHLEAEQLYQGLATFRQELQSRGEATDLFAQEKQTGQRENDRFSKFIIK
jgi:prophage antirepressor-like protein